MLVAIAIVLPVVAIALGGCHGNLGNRRRHIEQAAAAGQLGFAVTIGKEAVVPDPHESRRHHVQQEAPDEFVGIKLHHALGRAMPIVFPPEPDLAVVDVEQCQQRL